MTSNVGWKWPSYEEHPVTDFIRQDCNISLSSDNLLLSGSADREPNPTLELERLVCLLDLDDDFNTVNIIKQIILNGVKSSFIDEEKKKKLLIEYEKTMEEIIQKEFD